MVVCSLYYRFLLLVYCVLYYLIFLVLFSQIFLVLFIMVSVPIKAFEFISDGRNNKQTVFDMKKHKQVAFSVHLRPFNSERNINQGSLWPVGGWQPAIAQISCANLKKKRHRRIIPCIVQNDFRFLQALRLLYYNPKGPPGYSFKKALRVIRQKIFSHFLNTALYKVNNLIYTVEELFKLKVIWTLNIKENNVQLRTNSLEC